MKPSLTLGSRIVSVVAVVLRVLAGILWCHEGYIKYRAGFNATDISLVVDSVTNNPRSADWYEWFTFHVLGKFPELFGFLIPMLEIGLGVALVVGVLTVPSALMSVLTLMTYWLADQLTDVYPILVLLSTLVILAPAFAVKYSITSWVLARSHLGKALAGNPRVQFWL